ncbi:DUF4214 domain-containing protein [Telmatocola sphagniphila]|uniref:DUF4214 domain-containing protein n=1 Tax=Telmatocola sphagniphila TaxID=1123043 RepID=A0A8E6BA67_9BACT|nr:DUF4214 domain-containing protein [Telmatocola sphagniphila]QVL33230.1 DUF4214 domain-containing protein [Telmatocola sphagniphila]
MMRISLVSLVAVTVLATSPTIATDPRFDAAQFVRSVYLSYLDREPDAAGVANLVQQLRNGTTPSDIKASILSSQEFYQRCQNNPRLWVASLYAKVLNRNGKPFEINQWMDRINVNNGDRLLVAREFLATPEANGISGNIIPPPIVEDIPAKLVSVAHQLHQSVQSEIPPALSNLARVQANNYLKTCISSQPILTNPAANPILAQQSLVNCERALIAFRTTLNDLPVSAPMSRRRLQQSNELLEAIRNGLTGGVVIQPPVVPPIGPGFDNPGYEFFSRQMAELARDSSQMVYLIRTILGRSLTYTQLLNEMENFSANVDRARDKLRNGITLLQFQADIQALRKQANSINSRFNAGIVDSRVTETWYATNRVLNQIAERAGLNGGSYINPNSTPVISPTFNQLPYQVVPNNSAPPRSKVIELIDQALSQTDTILIANNALLFQYPSLARYLAQMKSFRASLVSFRADAISGMNPTLLSQRVEQLNASLRGAETLYNQIGITAKQNSVQEMRNLYSLLTQISRQIYQR